MVGKWATIRFFRDQLVVTAPDFIHRQIDGYPTPIRPAKLALANTDEKPRDAVPVTQNPAN
jgi:hypothetical protein